MIATSIFGFMSSFFALSPFLAILDLYICCFGVLAVCLEYKDQIMMKRYVDIIRKEAHFLTIPSGRAIFYIFAGVLIVSKGGLPNLFAGIFIMLVGGIIHNSCRQAYLALNELHNKKYTEEYIISNFKKHDKDNSGQLDTKELGEVRGRSNQSVLRFRSCNEFYSPHLRKVPPTLIINRNYILTSISAMHRSWLHPEPCWTWNCPLHAWQRWEWIYKPGRICRVVEEHFSRLELWLWSLKLLLYVPFNFREMKRHSRSRQPSIIPSAWWWIIYLNNSIVQEHRSFCSQLPDSYLETNIWFIFNNLLWY